jgi:endonuclease/exonuclease/phosphatase (EEP) superfamily protein YafD
MTAEPSGTHEPRRLQGVALGGLLLLGGLSLLGPQIVAPPLPLIALLTVLPWLWLGLTASIAVWALVLSDRVLGLLAGAGCAVFVLGWMSVWPTRGDVVEGRGLRVLTWNVQRLGWEDADDSERLGCVAEEVERVRPDAVAFLEVSSRDVERLEARLGLSCVHIDYEGTERPTFGGVASCARGDRWTVGESGPRRFTEDLDWYYVFTEFLPVEGGRPFNFITVHLQPHSQLPGAPEVVVERHQRETAALLERMERLQDPTVLAGDFNSARDAAIHTRLRHTLRDTFEQGGWGPGFTVLLGGLVPLRIDYIYASEAFGIRDAVIPRVDCSDHRPVVADLVLPAEAG